MTKREQRLAARWEKEGRNVLDKRMSQQERDRLKIFNKRECFILGFMAARSYQKCDCDSKGVKIPKVNL